MDPNAVLDYWRETCISKLNAGKPERTGKHAFAVARFCVSFWAKAMNDGSVIVELTKAMYDAHKWVEASLSNEAWVTVVCTPPEKASMVLAVIIHCDDDTDAVMVKLAFDNSPVIEL